MALKNTIKTMYALLAQVSKDLVKAEKGNRAASQRVRARSIQLEKVAKLYRKESIKSEKGAKGKKKTSAKTVKQKKKKSTTRKKVVTRKKKTTRRKRS